MERVSVLVIDDEEDVRSLFRTHLRGIGCAVRTAATGEEGLRLASEEPPDIVFLDMMLPGLEGSAVLGRLRTDPSTSPCRIAIASVLDHDDLIGLGADASLPKPFLRGDLVRVIDELSGTVKEGS